MGRGWGGRREGWGVGRLSYLTFAIFNSKLICFRGFDPRLPLQIPVLLTAPTETLTHPSPPLRQLIKILFPRLQVEGLCLGSQVFAALLPSPARTKQLQLWDQANRQPKKWYVGIVNFKTYNWKLFTLEALRSILRTRVNVTVRSRISFSRSILRETSRMKGENQEQTQPTFGVVAGISTRAHYGGTDTTAPPLFRRNLLSKE